MAMVLGMGAAVSATTYTITPDMTKFTIGTYTYTDAEGQESQKGSLSGNFIPSEDNNVKFPVVIYQESAGTKVDGIAGQDYELRWYQDMKMTIEAPAGFTIRKITFVLNKNNKAKTITSNCGGTVTDAAGTGKDNQIVWSDETGVTKFDATASEKQVRTYQIIISDEVGDVPPTPPTPEIEKVANIAAFIAKCAENDGPTLTIDAPVTVTYQNGRYLYLKDESGVMAVYGDLDTKYENGDIIPAGITGVAQIYSQGIYQLSSPDKATFKEATKGAAVEPVDVTVGAITKELVSTYVLLKNVTVSEVMGDDGVTPKANNYTISDEEGDEALLFNQFSNEKFYDVVEVMTGEGLDVYAIVTVYKGAPQLYPVKVTKSSGIAVVELDENAPVEYYNLQGVRVANPENGLYIRRQGATATKVLVK